MPAIMKAFQTIGLAKTSTSAPEAREIGFLRSEDGITMNKDRLLHDAKLVAINLIETYVKPEKLTYRLPGKTAFAALELGLKGMINNGQISEHDKLIGHQIATILSGGETASYVFLDAILRLIPGVIGNENSVAEESFENGLLEYPQYTKPQIWEKKSVPNVLLSGDHAKIKDWRLLQSEAITRDRRPDLWQKYNKKN